jgi:phage-related protein
VVLFAYDTNILVIDKNENALQDKINKVMMQLEAWFSMNNMIINSENSKPMYIQLNKIQDCIEPDITFKKVKINYTSQFRFLGINKTNKQKWNIHIQSACKELSKTCYIIKDLKVEVSPHILRNVYFAKFQSHISCGLIFWGGESESNRILILQKRVLPIMKGVTKRTSCRDI